MSVSGSRGLLLLHVAALVLLLLYCNPSVVLPLVPGKQMHVMKTEQLVNETSIQTQGLVYAGSELTTTSDATLNVRVRRELSVSLQHVRVQTQTSVATEASVYHIELSEPCADALVKLLVFQNGAPLSVSRPLRLNGVVTYMVTLDRSLADEEDVLHASMEVDAFFTNPIGALGIESHQRIKEFFAFRSPYNTLDMTSVVRRVDALTPLIAS